MDRIPEPSDELYRHIWGRRSRTIYKLRLSVLYHLKRERFFDLVDKVVSATTAIAATTAVAVLLKQVQEVDVAFAGITAALSLMQVIFNPAERARHHGQVAGEFRRLLVDCERAGERWSEQQCDEFSSKVVEIEAGERAPLAALVLACQNQLNAASGQPEDVVRLRMHERLLMHWVDFDATKIIGRQGHATAQASQ